MSEVKLLPLPEVPADDDVLYAWAEDYARANMEPLIAENERLRAEVSMLTHAVEQGHATIKLGHQLHDALAGEMREAGVVVESDPIRVVNLRAERLEAALRGAANFLVKTGFASEAEYFLAHAALDQEGGNG